MSAQQIGDGAPDGVLIGASATEKVAFHGATPAVQGSALTTQLTTITPADAVGTPDYAIQAIHNSSAYGFVNAAEAITLLYVVQNLQTRLAQVEVILETKGLCAAN